MMSENSKSTLPVIEEWKHLWNWLILLGIGLTWGSSYFFIKKALVVFDPFQISALRIFITFLCFLPFAINKIRFIKREQWKFFAIVSVFGSALPSFLFPMAQTQLSSSYTGVLSSTTPIFTLSLGALFYGLSLSRRKIMGVIIGFTGAVALIVLSGQGALEGNPWFALLAFLATLFYAISSNTINTYLKETGTLTISSMSFFVLGLPALIFLCLDGTHEVWTHSDKAWEGFMYIVALAVLGTVLATLFYFKLIKMAGVIFASTISYVIPCFAVLIGLLDGEILSWVHVFGMTLIIMGIYLTGKR